MKSDSKTKAGNPDVTGVTTPLDKILSDWYMYLDAYDRRSYSLSLSFRQQCLIVLGYSFDDLDSNLP
jgi:hypothetical protein